ncbi:MAG: type II toxin-antitoxin system HicA family toxin [Chloroflexota bacterium]
MNPLSQQDVIRKFKNLGFEGPRQQGRHPFMSKGPLKVFIEGRHGRDIPIWLQQKFLRQAGISKDDWDKA